MRKIPPRQSILVVGIGTELRGDDAAGLLAVRLLSARGAPDSVRFLECSDDGVSLIDAWAGFDAVVLVDAISAGLPPGTVVTADVREQGAPLMQRSTHHIGLAETIGLARALNVLPPMLLLYGVQGKSFRPGEDLSPEVMKAVDRIVAGVSADLHQWHGTPTGEWNGVPRETCVPVPESKNGGSG